MAGKFIHQSNINAGNARIAPIERAQKIYITSLQPYTSLSLCIQSPFGNFRMNSNGTGGRRIGYM